MEPDRRLAFDFLRTNERSAKPRTVGLTEIRGPYYAAVGPRYLEDILSTMGSYVDSFKLNGATMPLMSESTIQRYIEICHNHDVKVSTGGLIEFVLTQGPEAVKKYLDAAADYGFDIIEISTGMVSVPFTDYIRLVQDAKKRDVEVKAEIGIQFGAGGASSIADLEAEGTGDARWAVQRAKMALDAGADIIMLESEGITERVREWRTDVPAAFIAEIGLENVMFEAADPEVFSWYVKNYGSEVSLFVDHSQIFELECIRSGIWGTKSIWGRVITYKG